MTWKCVQVAAADSTRIPHCYHVESFHNSIASAFPHSLFHARTRATEWMFHSWNSCGENKQPEKCSLSGAAHTKIFFFRVKLSSFIHEISHPTSSQWWVFPEYVGVVEAHFSSRRVSRKTTMAHGREDDDDEKKKRSSKREKKNFQPNEKLTHWATTMRNLRRLAHRHWLASGNNVRITMWDEVKFIIMIRANEFQFIFHTSPSCRCWKTFTHHWVEQRKGRKKVWKWTTFFSLFFFASSLFYEK